MVSSKSGGHFGGYNCIRKKAHDVKKVVSNWKAQQQRLIMQYRRQQRNIPYQILKVHQNAGSWLSELKSCLLPRQVNLSLAV